MGTRIVRRFEALFRELYDMQNRMSMLVWVAAVSAVSLVGGLLLPPITGCIGLDPVDFELPDEDPLPVLILQTTPADGGEIRVDGRLVIYFDGEPGIVTVNGFSATVTDRTAVWTATGLNVGERVTLNVTWESEENDTAAITLTVIESTCAPSGDGCVDLLSTEPADGGSLPEGDLFVMSFSDDPGPVTVNGIAADVLASRATWYTEGLAAGEQVVLDIVWNDGSTTITLTVVVPAAQPACAEVFSACETDDDCCTDPCVFGFCGGACAEPGAACEGDGDCCDELPCVNGTCTEGEQCVQTSFPCQSDAECCSMIINNEEIPVFCVAGSCGGVCQQPRQPCGEAQLCCDDVPCVNGVCTCAGFNDACETDDDCCSNLPCVNNKCI